MNHEYYVSSEIAKLLEKAGFDWEIKTFYFNNELHETILGEAKNHNFSKVYISAPTLEVAQRWLREVKKLYIEIRRMPKCDLFDRYFTSIAIMQEPFDTELRDKDDEIIYISGKTYEKALEATIKKALEIILAKGE